MRTFSRNLSRRGVLGLGAGAAAAASLAGCGGSTSSDGAGHPDGSGKGTEQGSKAGTRPARPIGDGSTSFTGKQPHQPARPEPLEPGQTPPQFVVFSWDGA
ncbi:hypothetical protein GT346_36020, partial [Streptomyces sp. SID161]|nr:hypothetical protein [Streptomyces sp. SID161]